MKMLRHSPDELILLHRPVVLCTVLLAGALFLAGVTVWNFGNADWLKAGLGAHWVYPFPASFLVTFITGWLLSLGPRRGDTERVEQSLE